MSHIPCEFCGGSATSIRYDFGAAKIMRCKECRTSFTYPKPTEQELSSVYDEDYFSNSEFLSGKVSNTYGYYDYDGMKEINQLENIRISNHLKKLFDGNVANRKLLDVGCGLGAFLKSALEAGFEVEGIEFNQYAAEKVSSEIGITVHGKEGLKSLLSAREKFDVIVLFDVIEHLLDPLETVHQVRELLVGDGILLIGTTDFEHPIPRLLGKRFEDFRRIREHIFFLGKKELVNNLEMNGFSHLTSEPQKLYLRASDLGRRLVNAQIPGAVILKKIFELNLFSRVSLPINFGMKYVAYFRRMSPPSKVHEDRDTVLDGALLSIIIPVLNEASTIATVIKRVSEFQMSGVRSQILVVDDGSTDGTRLILQALKDEYDFDLVLSPRNRGKGAAVRTGIREAKGDLIIIQDADLEYSPSDYPNMLAPLLSGEADAVYGSRFLSPERRVMAFWHTLGNKVLTTFCNLCVNLNVTDMETCYKAMLAPVAKELDLKSSRFDIEPEITCKLALQKFRIFEVPIQYRARSASDGKKIGLKDAFEALLAILKYGVLRFR